MHRLAIALFAVALLALSVTAQDTTAAVPVETVGTTVAQVPPETTVAAPVTTVVQPPPETTVAVPPATTVAVPPATTSAVPPATTVAVPPVISTIPQETTVAVPPATTAATQTTTAAATPAATTEAPVLTTAVPQQTSVAPTSAAPVPTIGGATCASQCNCFCPAPATSCKDELLQTAATKCGRAAISTSGTNMTQMEWLDLCDACLWYVKREWSTACPQYDAFVSSMKADCRCVVRNEYACDNDGACAWDAATGNCRATPAYQEPEVNANGEVQNGQCGCGGQAAVRPRWHSHDGSSSAGRSCSRSVSLSQF